jgi:hypothetical protein
LEIEETSEIKAYRPLTCKAARKIWRSTGVGSELSTKLEERKEGNIFPIKARCSKERQKYLIGTVERLLVTESNSAKEDEKRREQIYTGKEILTGRSIGNKIIKTSGKKQFCCFM